MISHPLRVLWVTNMFPNHETGEIRGNFVELQHDALEATGEVAIDVELVGQGRGCADYLLANWRVHRRWQGFRFDLVHVHYGITGSATMLIPPRVPFIFSIYGSDVNLGMSRMITRIVAWRARRRVFVSQRLAEKWPSSRNVVLPNGIDFSVCHPKPREESCAALGLDSSRKWILFGSSPHRQDKGYDVFTDVVDCVRKEHGNAEAIILTERGQSYSRVVDKLNAADVLLFTSRRGLEGSPTVVKEALAVGLPVVTVDVGDVREMLDGVSPGGVVDWPRGRGSRKAWIEELAEAVGRVLGSGRRADGREKRRHLDQGRVAQETLKIYREVLEES